MRRALQDLALFLLGILSGAMLLIALSFLLIWQSLPPVAFLEVFAVHAQFIGAYMVPLGGAATAAAVLAAIGTWRLGGTARSASLIAAAASVALGLLYPLLFSELNASFVARSIALSDVPDALARWASWHWVRTTLGVVAFAAELVAIRASSPR